ncbi:MAG: HU family DNA-binding protein [Shewanella algae]|uniref:HU family DNA-binding protein n=1 Tax=Shewanella algae TaxID=38313 RepID=UPI0031F5BEFB
MNKSELMTRIAYDSDLTQKEAAAALNALTAAITHALVEGQVVALAGFGTFRVSARRARQGRNPLTGEALVIPAKAVPTFKAGKSLKEALNHIR